jgi:LysM repeat protein
MFPARSRRALVRAKAIARRSESVSEAQQLLLPLLLAFGFALLLAWPHRVQAQAAGASVTASAASTHTVRPGETLWSLAARYFGNGQKWRELASMNGLAAGGELGIEVGQVLRVPGERPSFAESRAAMAERPPMSTPSSAVTPAAGTPDASAEKTAADKAAADKAAADTAAVDKAAADKAAAEKAAFDAAAAEIAAAESRPAPLPAPQRGTFIEPEGSRGASRLGLVRRADVAAARGRDNTTIFLGPAPFDADTMQGTIYLTGGESFVEPAGRRPAEFEAAPFAVSASALKDAGSVKARGDARAVKTRDLQLMQPRELVEITFPAGVAPTPGTKLVSISLGAELGSTLRVAHPSAVLTVEEPRNGVPMARITRLFGVVEQGQALVPFEEAPAAAATESVDSIATTVRWITAKHLLPSLQSYLILANAASGQIQVGDRFELLTESAVQSRVAIVRVVRVGAEGATAIITHQDLPTIREGMSARRIGRAP